MGDIHATPEISPDGTAVISMETACTCAAESTHTRTRATGRFAIQDSGPPTRGRSCLPTGPT